MTIRVGRFTSWPHHTCCWRDDRHRQRQAALALTNTLSGSANSAPPNKRADSDKRRSTDLAVVESDVIHLAWREATMSVWLPILYYHVRHRRYNEEPVCARRHATARRTIAEPTVTDLQNYP